MTDEERLRLVADYEAKLVAAEAKLPTAKDPRLVKDLISGIRNAISFLRDGPRPDGPPNSLARRIHGKPKKAKY